MPKDPRIPDGVTNPFSDAFLDTWQLWKDFRWQEHRFKYKGCISEQARLMELCEVSEGSEEKAIAIIKRSMSNGWKGFYKVRSSKKDGKSTDSGNSTRESLNQLYAAKSGKGGFSTTGASSKAV